MEYIAKEVGPKAAALRERYEVTRADGDDPNGEPFCQVANAFTPRAEDAITSIRGHDAESLLDRRRACWIDVASREGILDRLVTGT